METTSPTSAFRGPSVELQTASSEEAHTKGAAGARRSRSRRVAEELLRRVNLAEEDAWRSPFLDFDSVRSPCRCAATFVRVDTACIVPVDVYYTLYT